MKTHKSKKRVVKIKQLHERLENLTGKSVKYTLREDTWAIPDTPKKVEKVEKAIYVLDRLRDTMYHTAGDDKLFDHLTGAMERLEELKEEGAEKYQSMIDAAQERMEKDREDEVDVEQPDQDSQDDGEDQSEGEGSDDDQSQQEPRGEEGEEQQDSKAEVAEPENDNEEEDDVDNE